MNRQTGSLWLAVVVLAFACCQVGIGARFSTSGEQLGLALPVSALVLAIATAVWLALSRDLSLPELTWPQSLFVALSCIGLLGMTRAQATGAAKELVQLVEIALVAPFLFRRLMRDHRRDALHRTLAVFGVALMALRTVGVTRAPVFALSEAKSAAIAVMAWPFVVTVAIAWRSRWRIAVLAACSVLAGATFTRAPMLVAWLAVLALLAFRLGKPALRAIAVCALLTVAASLVPRPGHANPWLSIQPRVDAEHHKRLWIETAAAVDAPRLYPFGGGLGRYRQTINHLKQRHPERIPHPRDEKVPKDGNCQYVVTAVEAGVPAALALLALLGAALAVAGRTGEEDDQRPWAAALQASLLGAALSGLFCVTLSRGTGIWLGALIGLSGTPSLPTKQRVIRLLVPACAALGFATTMVVVNRSADADGVTPANSRAGRLLFRGNGTPVRVVVVADDLTSGDAPGTIRVEGESCVRLAKPFVVIPANDASAGLCLAIPNNTGKGIGEAEYAVEVREAGEYRFFAQVFWEDGCSNSLRVETAGQPAVISSEVFRAWHTLASKKTFHLPAGRVPLKVRNLEDGIRLDYWGLKRVK